MVISVIDPIGRAFNRMKHILFQPFDLGKWFVLGFCAFLAYLGEGGSSSAAGQNYSRGPVGGGGGTGSGPPDIQQAIDWVRANLSTVITIAVVALVVILGISALLIWLRSRGKFMFLDGVVRNRGAVVEPWKKYRVLGNSLFVFTFNLGVAGFMLFLVILATGIYMAWPDIEAWQFTSVSVTAIVVSGSMFVALGIAAGIIGMILEDFVIPTMYRHDLLVLSAWSVVGSEIVSNRLGTILLYIFMKALLALAIGAIATMATCATCCIAAVPYLGTVLLLPLLVFRRCYSICFLEQFGPDWTFFDRVDSDDMLMPES